jgi:hypothetical protein
MSALIAFCRASSALVPSRYAVRIVSLIAMAGHGRRAVGQPAVLAAKPGRASLV